MLRLGRIRLPGPPLSQGRRRIAGELPQLAARVRWGHFSAGGWELRVGPRAQPEVGVHAMATGKPPGRGCGALPRWLLGAALLLGLRLCIELRHAGSGPPGRDSPGPPRTHLLSAPGLPRGARRRQVTYVRSGRRVLPRGGGSTTPPEPSCCAQHGLPRRKVSCKPYRHGPWS